VPCYRCGTLQADPEAGKSSPWRRGVVREHQVLICPACQPSALADLTRCSRCGSAHLIRRLDQVECLDCRLIRDAEPEPPAAGSLAAESLAAESPGAESLGGEAPSAAPSGSTSGPAPATATDRPSPASSGGDLAGEVARALDRLRGNR